VRKVQNGHIGVQGVFLFGFFFLPFDIVLYFEMVEA
jgi:hypothetical protein